MKFKNIFNRLSEKENIPFDVSNIPDQYKEFPVIKSWKEKLIGKEKAKIGKDQFNRKWIYYPDSKKYFFYPSQKSSSPNTGNSIKEIWKDYLMINANLNLTDLTKYGKMDW